MHSMTVNVGEVTLGALAAGHRERPALVLLHGWPQSNHVYDQVIDPLGEDYFVLAFDLPLVGASRGSPPSAEKTVLADIVLAAAERAGGRSVVLAGFDVGGMIAFAAARDHASRLRGAVVMNTVLPGIDPWSATLSDPRIWHFAFHSIPKLPETLVAGHQREYFDYFIEALVGNKAAVTDAYRRAFAHAYERPEALQAGFDWYRAMSADAEHNQRHRPIDLPLLYLRGDADGRSPAEYLAGLRRAGARGATSDVISGSGELSPLEQPEAFMRAIRRFAAACQSAE